MGRRGKQSGIEARATHSLDTEQGHGVGHPYTETGNDHDSHLITDPSTVDEVSNAKTIPKSRYSIAGPNDGSDDVQARVYLTGDDCVEGAGECSRLQMIRPPRSGEGHRAD